MHAFVEMCDAGLFIRLFYHPCGCGCGMYLYHFDVGLFTSGFVHDTYYPLCGYFVQFFLVFLAIESQ